MASFIKVSAIIMLLLFKTLIANATNGFTSSDDFTLTIDFVDPITLSVDNLNINNVVGGDVIDKDVVMISSKDPDRNTTCNTAPLTLSASVEPDITSIVASVNTTCIIILSLDGALPTNAAIGFTYAGAIIINYAYNITVFN